MKSRRPSTDVPLATGAIAPVLVTIAKGTRWWRVHPSKYHPTEFNPNDNPALSPGRFHPFTDTAGQFVPTMYASDQMVGALAETVFHNTTGQHDSVPRTRLENRILSDIQTIHALTLASLKGPDVKALGVLRQHLVESFPDQHLRTATGGAPCV